MSQWLETPGSALVPVRQVPSEPPIIVRGARVAVGLATQAGQALDRATGGSGNVPAVVDAAIGITVTSVEVTSDAVHFVAHITAPITNPVANFIVNPPFLPTQLRPNSIFTALTDRGRVARYAMDNELSQAANSLSPVIVEAVLERIDLTDIVIDQVDLTRVVQAVLDDMDLTQIVIDRVDIDAIASKLDMNPIIDRIPIIDIANYVIDEIDLPKIVRESTGGLAGEAVRGVRLQSMELDDSLSEGVDKIIRRKRRKTEVSGYKKERRIKWLAKFQEDMSSGQPDPTADKPVPTGSSVDWKGAE